MQKKYYIIYKGYNILSQFSKEENSVLPSLRDVYPHIEKDVYPIGRLDADSEGLLILTNDTSLNGQLLHPKKKIEKTYWVQVEGEANIDAILALESGVIISLSSGPYQTKKCKISKMTSDQDRCLLAKLPERVPPIRFRKNQNTSWLCVKLEEGKNRQIRKMFAKVGFPVLRLVRFSIQNLCLSKFESNSIKPLLKLEILKLLKFNV